MNSLDKKLYELFSPDKTINEWCHVIAWDFNEEWKYMMRIKDRIYIGISKQFISNRHYSEIKEILWHEPQLHDVFRVAKERDWIMNQDEAQIWIAKYPIAGNHYIPYNSTLPLLQQSDTTKQSIIDLFF
jgi:hypothetical protein